jgi:hypothetical protein
MTDSKAKGNRGEVLVRTELRARTGLNFEKTPHSGALSIEGMKGDLYLPNQKNEFTIEVKNYEGDGFGSHLLEGKGDFLRWWEQAVAASKVNKNIPMVIYKWNRSKLYCALPNTVQTGVGNKIVTIHCSIYLLSELNLKQLFGVL